MNSTDSEVPAPLLMTRLSFNVFVQQIQHLDGVEINDTRDNRFRLAWLKLVADYTKVGELQYFLSYLMTRNRLEKFKMLRLGRAFSFYKYKTKTHLWKRISSQLMDIKVRIPQFERMAHRAAELRAQETVRHIAQKPLIQSPLYGLFFATLNCLEGSYSKPTSPRKLKIEPKPELKSPQIPVISRDIQLDDDGYPDSEPDDNLSPSPSPSPTPEKVQKSVFRIQSQVQQIEIIQTPPSSPSTRSIVEKSPEIESDEEEDQKENMLPPSNGEEASEVSAPPDDDENEEIQRTEIEQKEREQKEKEQREKEQKEKEQREKEQREKEQREKEQREKEQREKEQKEKEQKEKEQREKEQKEKEQREKEQREKEQREKEQREKEQREKEQKEKEEKTKTEIKKEEKAEQPVVTATKESGSKKGLIITLTVLSMIAAVVFFMLFQKMKIK